MTRLRQLMLEELQRRNYAATTREYYLRTLTRFARYFRRPPDQLTPQHIVRIRRTCCTNDGCTRTRSDARSRPSGSST